MTDKRETVEQFLARGGVIDHPSPRPMEEYPTGIDVMRQRIQDARRANNANAKRLAGIASGAARRAKADAYRRGLS